MSIRRGIIVSLSAFVVPYSSALGQSGPVLEVTVKSPIDQHLAFSTVEVSGGLAKFTNDAGSVSLRLPSTGTYRLKLRHLGYSPVDTTITLEPGEVRRSLTVVLQPAAIRVSTISVKARTTCKVLSDSQTELGRLVGELRKNAEREVLLRRAYPFMYTLARVYETTDNHFHGVNRHRDVVRYSSLATDKYVAGQLVRGAKRPRGGSTRELRIPTLIDIAEDEFLKSHCFSYAGESTLDGREVYRIDFEPIPGLNGADVRGSAFIDKASYLIRRTSFGLTNGHLLRPSVIGVEVTTSYREIVPGFALVDHIRAVQTVPRTWGGKDTRVDEQRLVAIDFLRELPGIAGSVREPHPRRF